MGLSDEQNAAITASFSPEWHRWSATVRIHDRAWRTKQRAANLAPLSTKVRHKGGKVEVVAVKKGRGK